MLEQEEPSVLAAQALSYDSGTGVIITNTKSGDISQGVTAGDGLSGGGSSGNVSLAVDSSP